LVDESSVRSKNDVRQRGASMLAEDATLKKMHKKSR